jgi:co-chaperonin GroES (HSP10)
MPSLRESVRLVGDRILIKPIDASKTSGGIFIPDSIQDEVLTCSGYVVRVGPGSPISPPEDVSEWMERKDKISGYIPLQVHIGDFVVYFRKAAVCIEFDGVKYNLVNQGAILLYDSINDNLG